MNIPVDTNVTFTLQDAPAVNGTPAAQRSVTVDALDLDDFLQGMWQQRGELKPQNGPDGKPMIGDDGNPVQVREIGWPVIEKEFGAWLKIAAPSVELKRSEIRGIWSKSGGVWAKKNESWQQSEAEKDSQTLPQHSDPRYSD